MAKSKVFWITRDKDGYRCIWDYREFPKKDDDGMYCSDHGRILNTSALIKHVTLAPGQRVKATLEIKE